MDQGLFVDHLQEFVRKHGIETDLESRWHKLQIEVNELADAILGGDKKEIVKEAADVANVAFHIMILCGVTQPLWTMYLKLQEVAARHHYQLRAKRIAEGSHDETYLP